ncbi:unnamed protein product, partial [Amoebophrya sp. A120]|eukprot:GSA120T00011921001.1
MMPGTMGTSDHQFSHQDQSFRRGDFLPDDPEVSQDLHELNAKARARSRTRSRDHAGEDMVLLEHEKGEGLVLMQEQIDQEAQLQLEKEELILDREQGFLGDGDETVYDAAGQQVVTRPKPTLQIITSDDELHRSREKKKPLAARMREQQTGPDGQPLQPLSATDQQRTGNKSVLPLSTTSVVTAIAPASDS